MAQQEKNFLQSIKLEISRNFKLTPYERIAFHRILGILRTDVGKNILLNEIERGPDIRQSSISVLAYFKSEDVTQRLKPLLKEDITPTEIMHILNHLEQQADIEDIQDIIDFLDKFEEGEANPHVIGKAFSVLKSIGAGTDTVLNYLLTLINSEEPNPNLQEHAILSLSAFRIVSSFEEILRKKMIASIILCTVLYMTSIAGSLKIYARRSPTKTEYPIPSQKSAGRRIKSSSISGYSLEKWPPGLKNIPT